MLRRHGYKVVTVDCDPKWGADVKVDILRWDYEGQFPAAEFPFDVIAASPPCTEYSSAMTARRPRMLEAADSLVAKALEIVRHYKPRLWWVENPRGGLLKTRDVVAGLPWLDADYCQFSACGFQKPTRFWCCAAIASRKSIFCDGRQCENLDLTARPTPEGRRRHRCVIAGKGRPPAKKEDYLRIPARLVEYLCGFSDSHGEMQTPTSRRGEPRRCSGEWQAVKRQTQEANNGIMNMEKIKVQPCHACTAKTTISSGTSRTPRWEHPADDGSQGSM